jgi:hypothetical protein
VKEDLPQIRAKEIQVKQLDRNITHLRASQSIGNINRIASSPASVSGSVGRNLSPIGGGSVAGGGSGGESISRQNEMQENVSEKYALQARNLLQKQSLEPGQLLPENSLSLLNACICRVMNQNNHLTWSDRVDGYENFFRALDLLSANEPNMDDVIASTLVEIKTESQLLADACTVTPKQFWKVADLFCSVLVHAAFTSASFSAGLNAFDSLGFWISRKDPQSSLALFCDFALAKLAPTLLSNPQKRLGILQLLYSFAPSDSNGHIQCIKRLQSLIPDLSIFVQCLVILAANERKLDSLLLDLYTYYATIGLSNNSPRIRAGAVSIFAGLFPQSELFVASQLPLLEDLSRTETWWEMQAHLVHVCGLFLSLQRQRLQKARLPPSEEKRLPNQEVSDENDQLAMGSKCAVRILGRVLSGDLSQSAAFLSWSASCIAPAVGFSAMVDDLFFEVLEKVELEDRLYLLGLDAPGEGSRQAAAVRSIPLPSSTGIAFAVEPVHAKWHPLSVARIVREVAAEEATERLSALQLQILHAVLLSLVNADPAAVNALSGTWLEIYSAVKNFVFVGLCNPECVLSSVGILTAYLFNSKLKEAVITDPFFVGVMRLLYPNNETAQSEGTLTCQYVFESFLRDTFSCGRPFDVAAHNVLLQFSKSNAALYASATSLQKLLKEFAGQVR